MSAPDNTSQLNSTAWMLRARELEAELATARAETAVAQAETARERLMRSRLAAEIADRAQAKEAA